jgi:acetyltransferase
MLAPAPLAVPLPPTARLPPTAPAPPGRLVVRPLTPADRRAVAFALRHLGERSRYQRYLTGSPQLDGRELDRLLTVDHWHHEVLIAFHGTPRIPLGVGEYVRSDAFDVAELAVAVADDWQRHGVGAALTAALRERALAAGIRRFSASVLRDNRAAVALLHRLGDVRRLPGGGPVAELVVSLDRGN